MLYYGVCKFLVAFCTDLKQRTKRLNEAFLTWIEAKEQATVHRRLKHEFSKLVTFHCDIKVLAEQTSAIYNPVIAAFIVTGGCFLGTNLFELHLVGKKNVWWHLVGSKLLFAHLTDHFFWNFIRFSLTIGRRA